MHALSDTQAAVDWLSQRVTGGLTVDSRTVRPGDGFIAWPGSKTDGRVFVNAALASGAAACLVEHSGVVDFGFSDDRIATFHGLKDATGPISAAFLGEPSHHLSLVAVTGTNGKTSTAFWIAQALAKLPSGGEKCGLIGTFGVGIPEFSGEADSVEGETLRGIQSTGLTTPDPVTFNQTLRRFVASGVHYCATEASSIGLSEQRLKGAKITTAIFTNLTLDHLDYHGTLENYWAAKRGLFDWPGLKAAVVNVDDSYGAQLANDLAKGSPDLSLWTCSVHGNARLRAANIKTVGRGMQMDIAEQSENHRLAVELIGNYNVSNLLGVIGAMRSLGIPLQDAVNACCHLQSVPGRMECFGGNDEPLVVVDYAHTPDALEKVLLSLRPYVSASQAQLICVFGCGGDRDTSKRPLMGAAAAKLADRTIVTNDNPRFEVAAKIIAEIQKGIPPDAPHDVEPDRLEAICLAVTEARSGDVILIAGKGHEAFQEISGKRYPFSDRLCVTEALSRRKHSRHSLQSAA